MSRTRHMIHAIIGAVSILVIGMVLGVALDRVYLRPEMSGIAESGSSFVHEERHESFLRDMSADLDLSEEQMNHVHDVLSRHQSAVNDAWLAVHSSLNAAIDSVTAGIEEVLNPEQRNRLHDWLLARHGLMEPPGGSGGH